MGIIGEGKKVRELTKTACETVKVWVFPLGESGIESEARLMWAAVEGIGATNSRA